MDYSETCRVGIRQVSEFFFTVIIFSKKIITKKNPETSRTPLWPVSEGFQRLPD